MICREVFASLLTENIHLKDAVPPRVWRDVTFDAWNEYTKETKVALQKWPPKETPCGTKMEFRPEYVAALSVAKAIKDERIGALYRKHISRTITPSNDDKEGR